MRAFQQQQPHRQHQAQPGLALEEPAHHLAGRRAVEQCEGRRGGDGRDAQQHAGPGAGQQAAQALQQHGVRRQT